MKKNFKLVLALVLSIMMIVSSMAALADSNTKIRIGSADPGFGTAENTEAATLTGHKFNVYRILRAESSSAGEFTNLYWDDGVKEKTDALLTALKAKFDVFSAYTTGTPADGQKAFTAASFAQVISDSSFTTNLPELALVLRDYAVAQNVSAIVVDANTVTDLDYPGYYVVDDNVAGDGDTTAEKIMNPVVLFAVEGTTNELRIKAEAPKVVKKIRGNEDDDKTCNDEKVDYDTASIGHEIPYDITTTVPDMTSYKEYTMEFSDTLSGGLTFNPSSLTVTVGSINLTVKDETKDGNYTYAAADANKVALLTYTENPEGTANTISVKIPYLKFIDGVNKGDAVVVQYNATVNKKAVIGEAGNPNTVKLIYTRDPDHSGDGKPETPDSDVVTGETPEDTVITYVTGFEILKQDGQTTEALAGAKFRLTGTMVKKVLITGDFFEQDNASGTYWKLNDGTYTTTDPTGLSSETQAKYASLTDKYTKTTYTAENPKVEEKTTGVEVEAVSQGDGKLSFTGLGAGEYTFTEIEAPAGYNKLSNPIVINISGTRDTSEIVTTSDKVTWTVGTTSEILPSEVTFSNGVFHFTVKNNSGAVLPSTGGIGTTIFYVAGSIMVLAAAILLITKRRMGAED